MTINYLEQINEVFAFVSSDEGGEGIIGQNVVIDGRETFMPFVCADKERAESIKPMAKMIAQHSNITVKMIRLTSREVLETYNNNEEEK